MNEGWLTWLRGWLGTTVMWAAMGAVLVWCTVLVLAWPVEQWPTLAEFLGSLLGLGGLGASAGAVYGLLLTGFERGKSLDHLSLRRTALWGFLAGTIGPALYVLLSGGGPPGGSGLWPDYLLQRVSVLLVLGALFACLGVVVTLISKAARSDDDALDSMKEELLGIDAPSPRSDLDPSGR